MPWSRLRVNRPTDGGRRSSFVETAPVRDQQETQGHSIVPPHDANSNVKSPSPLRQSIDPSNVDAESPDVIESPTETDSSQTPRRRQRFSMLRYKHASDPQLFRTAKEQANAGVPPVPGGKSRKGNISSTCDEIEANMTCGQLLRSLQQLPPTLWIAKRRGSQPLHCLDVTRPQNLRRRCPTNPHKCPCEMEQMLLQTERTFHQAIVPTLKLESHSMNQRRPEFLMLLLHMGMSLTLP